MNLSTELLGPILVCWLAGGPGMQDPAPRLSVDSAQPSVDGTLRLVWSYDGDPDTRFVLEECRLPEGADRREIDCGVDRASFLSGLEDGRYRYRLRSVGVEGDRPGPWSAPAEVEVHHHSLAFAAGLCAVGAVVFLCIVGFLVLQARREDSAQAGSPERGPPRGGLQP